MIAASAFGNTNSMLLMLVSAMCAQQSLPFFASIGGTLRQGCASCTMPPGPARNIPHGRDPHGISELTQQRIYSSHCGMHVPDKSKVASGLS